MAQTELTAWLALHELGAYTDTFVQSEITLDDLSLLADADLRELGLPMGPRKRLLAAVAADAGNSDTGAKLHANSGLAPEAEVSTRAERRQLTVMFCDLVGSTDLSEKLDPEHLREVVRAYQTTAEEAIGRYGGHIAQYLGDGLLVYFGYPVAHEDDAIRAVYAGVDIPKAIGKLNQQLQARFSVRLLVRIGIHTGPVVVGEMGGDKRQENLAMGETPNLAARLQGLAEPDTVVISSATQQLVAGRFRLESLGTQKLKGLSAAHIPFRVIAEAQTESRFAASAHRTQHAMVGREDELALLVRRWQRAASGESQTVMVSGEPGIGKSRLIQALREQIAHEPHRPMLFQCSPFLQSTAFHPFIALLRRVGRIEPDLEDAQALQRLDAALRKLSTFNEDDTPLFASLLGLPCEFPPALRQPQDRRRRSVAALLRYLAGLAADAPAVAIFEDLHWADPATLEVLNRAVVELSDSRLLMVLTFRPEFACPWTGQSRTTAMPLSRISARETAALVASIAGANVVPDRVLATIIKRTDGVPLFVEELTRAVAEVESGRATASEDIEAAIPSSLHDSLMERLDRLGQAKEIAQAGSIIGREFGELQIGRLLGLESITVTTGLQALQQAGLVFRQTDGVSTRFSFKHALVQDAAYQSLLQARRKVLHLRAAQQFVAQTALPEIVAHHFELAGDAGAAITHWAEAARCASEQGAHAEALNHLARGLTLLENLPPDAARNLQRCDLLLQQASSMRVLDRFDEALEVLSQAEALALEPEDTRRLADICFLRGNLHFPRGNFDGCHEQHSRSLTLAQRAGDPEREARSLSGLGDASYMRGAMITAFGHFDRCVELGQQRNLQNIVAANQVMRGLARVYQNDIPNGLADIKASAKLAEETGALRAALVAYNALSYVLIDMGRLDDLHEPMERMRDLCEVTGARRFVCRYFTAAGLKCNQQGDARRAQELIEQAFATCEETGVAFQGAMTLGALALVTEDDTVRADVLRRGEVLLDQGSVSHNHFSFYRDAMQVSAQHGQWSELERYAERLAGYTRAEPLPYSELLIARGRALARFGRDPQDEQVRIELLRIRGEALRVGLRTALLPASVEAAVVA
ncbi:MAG: adenylate/guanylate cyclase domain-containing protein [Burkholderiaceae bacterium]